MSNSQLDLAMLETLLPSLIVEIAQLVGYEKALIFIKALGGTSFTMPTGKNRSDAEKMLLELLGETSAKMLMKRFGGERFYVPTCKPMWRDMRNQAFIEEIDKATKTGMSQATAIRVYAIKYGFSERWAYEILTKKQLEKNHERKS